jgi:prepilin-type N-terminal cleavage/methylation domain-containing protein
MRKNILRQRRGVTLVELTAVMAITAIISLMIVSFSTLISAQVKRNDARADFLQDVSTFRVATQQQFSAWESEVDAPDSFTVSVDEENKTISFADNILSFSDYATIDGVAVEWQGSLLKIIVTNEDLKAEQSFLLISHCGANFTKGGVA